MLCLGVTSYVDVAKGTRRSLNTREIDCKAMYKGFRMIVINKKGYVTID